MGTHRRFPAVPLCMAFALAAGVTQAQQPNPPRSGIEFASADIRALQRDDFANPGMLWVERGEKLWSEPAGSGGKSCASCHQDARASMWGAATRYPLVDGATKQLLNVEGRINQCRTVRQGAPAFGHESEALLSLTAYVAFQSRGMPLAASADGPARPHYEAGRRLYTTRMGQMNLACTQCHDANWGRQLLAEMVSQGQPNGYPAYRLEWQALGSLHRRLRACLFGIRAEPFPAGSPELLSLELYLAVRGKGLPVETPAVRR
jgi:sulfur-oxidizing protein SoxA